MPNDQIRQDDLRFDAAFQHREDGLSEATVKLYMETVDALPPIPVFLINKQPFPVGGFHRLEALRRLGREWVSCKLHHGTWMQAFEFSLGENAEHGLQRKNGDVKQAILDALEKSKEERLGWTDSAISKLVKCTQQWVSKIHAQLRQEEAEDTTDCNDEQEVEEDLRDPLDDPTEEEADDDEPDENPELKKLAKSGKIPADMAVQVQAMPSAARGSFVRKVKGGEEPQKAMETVAKMKAPKKVEKPKGPDLGPAREALGTLILELTAAGLYGTRVRKHLDAVAAVLK